MAAPRPSPKLLTVWRILLALVCCAPAFLLSLFFEIGGLIWCVGTAGWLGVFLFFYLFYFPRYYQSIDYAVDKSCLRLRHGVFTTAEKVIPLHAVQFTIVQAHPVYRVFGLAELQVVAPGSRMVIPGLERADANALAGILPGGAPPQE
jgi:Uncharacterized conserved protein